MSWLIYRTLTGQNGPGSNGNEGVLNNTQSFRTGASPSDVIKCHERTDKMHQQCRCWWYGSISWTFLSITHFIMFSSWAKYSSFCWKKLYSLIFIDTKWTFMRTKQEMWTHLRCEYCVSSFILFSSHCL